MSHAPPIQCFNNFVFILTMLRNINIRNNNNNNNNNNSYKKNNNNNNISLHNNKEVYVVKFESSKLLTFIKHKTVTILILFTIYRTCPLEHCFAQ